MNSEQKSIYDERSNSTFRSREMTYFWDGSKEETEYKEQIMKLVEMDPEILEDHFFDLSRPEARERCTRQIRRVAELRNAHKNDLRFRRTLLSILNSYDRSLGMRLYVHDTLFYETIYTQGTDEQFAQWKDIILETRCLGCFSMTELGHSSFLRGLETTATYDQTTQQFIINSPTLTSTKIWIGMAGQIATHTIALCQLIINNEEKGLHWFIVPLRDPESGRLLPGIAIGDVGAKMGRNGLDNGWIQFHKVSIPRGNMLMKWSHVAPDGKYKAPPNATIAYSSLIGERLLVNQATYDVVGQAVTIAIRYGAVRRQGNNNEQLLHYQSHQYNLFPVISTVYGCKFLYQYLDNYWAESLEIQKQGANGQSEFLKRSSDMHNLTAGLKSFVGWWAVEGLEQCRRGLGGHGYNAYNSIAGLIGDWGVITTGGGDNIVLAQQCARYLLSSYQRAVTGKQINGSVDYLNQYKTILNRGCPIKESSFFLKSQFQVELLEWLCVKLIDRSGSLLQCQLAQGATPENAWNENMMEIIETTKAHCVLYLLKIFIKTVEKAPNNLQPVLQRLCSLFALTNIQKLLVHFLTHNYLTNQHTSWLNKQIVTLCKEIRPDAVALVDSFNFPDWIIKAPLGAYDGDIYNKYFNTMVKAPNARGVVPYWNSIVKPMLQSKL